MASSVVRRITFFSEPAYSPLSGERKDAEVTIDWVNGVGETEQRKIYVSKERAEQFARMGR